MTETSPLIEQVDKLVGPRKIIACPWNCDGGYRGCDACNRCGTTGTGFRYQGKFYPNTEEGWRDALAATTS